MTYWSLPHGGVPFFVDRSIGAQYFVLNYDRDLRLNVLRRAQSNE